MKLPYDFRREVDQALARGDIDGALHLHERFREVYPEEALLPPRQLALADNLLGAHRLEAARRVLAHFLVAYPGHPEAALIESRLEMLDAQLEEGSR